VWEQIQSSNDTLVYFALASLATLLFLGKLLLVLLGADGGGQDGDFDVLVLGEDGGSTGTDPSASTFALFSVLSVLAFFMGAGWMGLAARMTWQLSPAASAGAAMGFGTACMLLSAVLMSRVHALNREMPENLATCVGQTAQVYLTIPAAGKGRGQVRVVVSGRSRVVPAESSGPELPAFASVTVISVRGDGCVLVQLPAGA